VRRIVRVVGGIIRFAVLAVLLAFRIALAALFAVITPIVMPILALLSGGGLLIAIGFACAGHWHDAAKGLWACFVCSVAFAVVACLVQLVNPLAFSMPVDFVGRRMR
jgi:tetrahydromethanopterin S-methyltransferase subunit D